MSSFKVGDYVRVIDKDKEDVKLGNIYKVTGVNPCGGTIITVEGSKVIYLSENFEKVNHEETI